MPIQVEKLNSSLLDKWKAFLQSLRASKIVFEAVADEISLHPLRNALIEISEQSAGFASELEKYFSGLIFSADAPGDGSATDTDPDLSDIEQNEEPGGELSRLCFNREHRLRETYNAFVSEFLPAERIKSALDFRMNSIHYAFMKINLLNASRFCVN